MEEKKKMEYKKFSAMFMLDIKANSRQEEAIVFLIDNLRLSVIKLFPTAKISVSRMDREN